MKLAGSTVFTRFSILYCTVFKNIRYCTRIPRTRVPYVFYMDKWNRCEFGYRCCEQQIKGALHNLLNMRVQTRHLKKQSELRGFFFSPFPFAGALAEYAPCLRCGRNSFFRRTIVF